MPTQTRWETFKEINHTRRAIRDFDGLPIDDHLIEEALHEAMMAPSSGNLQPYRFLWVKNPGLKATVAQACNDQRAAKSATTLIVLVTEHNLGLETLILFTKALAKDQTITDKTRTYHQMQTKKLQQQLRWLPLMLWSPLKALAAALVPTLHLFPLGPSGVSHWAARNSIYAAQNLLLALTAQGLDSCPMEGFNALKVVKLLGIKRTMTIPVVIAVGRRAPDAVVDPQWRRSFEQAVTVYP